MLSDERQVAQWVSCLLDKFGVEGGLLLPLLAWGGEVSVISHAEFLLFEALTRALEASGRVAPFAVVVDAVNDQAAAFYSGTASCRSPITRVLAFGWQR